MSACSQAPAAAHVAVRIACEIAVRARGALYKQKKSLESRHELATRQQLLYSSAVNVEKCEKVSILSKIHLLGGRSSKSDESARLVHYLPLQ
jgi:hypothetical protein